MCSPTLQFVSRDWVQWVKGRKEKKNTCKKTSRTNKNSKTNNNNKKNQSTMKAQPTTTSIRQQYNWCKGNHLPPAISWLMPSHSLSNSYHEKTLPAPVFPAAHDFIGHGICFWSIWWLVSSQARGQPSTLPGTGDGVGAEQRWCCAGTVSHSWIIGVLPALPWSHRQHTALCGLPWRIIAASKPGPVQMFRTYGMY